MFDANRLFGGGSSVSNPAPILSSIAPTSALVTVPPLTAAATNITITGSGFMASSKISWNGDALTTNYVNSTSLTAQVPLAYLMTAGIASISVVNPSPGGGTSASVAFTVADPVPSLTEINPVSAASGSDVYIDVLGGNFVQSSVVEWNGVPLQTFFSGSMAISARVPAAYLQTPGAATITVYNPAPGGGSTNGATFDIFTSVPATALKVVNVIADDLAWDPLNQVIYLSLLTSDGSMGDAVQVLNPATGTLGASAVVGSGPDLLSVSPNGKYLYVSLDGAYSVQRMTLPALGTDIEIPLGSDYFGNSVFALDMQAAPNADATVAVVRGDVEVSPMEEGGVVIYDDGVARPNVLCGNVGLGCSSNNGSLDLFDSIQWNGDGSQMFAANNESSSFDLYTIPVTAAGFGSPTDYPNVFTTFWVPMRYDAVTKFVYDYDGRVADPATGAVVGTFPASGAMVPDGAHGTAFFLGQTESQYGTTNYALEAFDIHTFLPIASMTIPSVVGNPGNLIRWGTNGLAFNSVDNYVLSDVSGAVYIITWPFAEGSANNLTNPPLENVKRSWKTTRKPFGRSPSVGPSATH